MEYVNLGKTGVKVSRICLGCMSYGVPPAGQPLRRSLETRWIEQLRKCVGLMPDQLPMLWDCDFLFGEPAAETA